MDKKEIPNSQIHKVLDFSPRSLASPKKQESNPDSFIVPLRLIKFIPRKTPSPVPPNSA